MKHLRILPYKPGSRSARLIARALHGLRVRFNGLFKPRKRHLVVNWGKVDRPRWWTVGLNDPIAVGRSSNKLTALSYLRQQGVQIPEFTREINVARSWLADGGVVVGRRILNGHGGIGCVVWDDPADIVDHCPLYTKHIRHRREFRIHVFKGKVIDQVEKLKRRGFEGRNTWIRNHENGYVFARVGREVPEAVRTEAIKACQALQLDFGAVDVAYREKEDKAFVLEANTAPGIENTTVYRYVEAIRQELKK